MQQSLRISQCVINRLQNVKQTCVGRLYGIFHRDILLIVGAHLQEAANADFKYCFPTEVDQCGAFKVTTEKVKETDASKILHDVLVTDSPLYLHKIIDSSEEIAAYYVINDRMQKVSYSIVTENEMYSDVMHLRLKTEVPLICELNQEAITEAIKQITHDMSSGFVAFNISKTDVYILGNTTEQISVSGESKIGDICNQLKQEDGQNDIRKKKTDGSQLDVLLVNMFKKATIDPYSEGVKKHAPIVHIDKKMDQMLIMSLELDALSLVFRDTKINRLYDILIESACRSLKLIQDILLKNFDENGGDQKHILSQPEIYHFLPSSTGHFITRVYDRRKSDSSLIDDRKILHTQFLLPVTIPMFRRANRYLFDGEQAIPGKLINPHEAVKLTNNGGEIALVRGKYAYYHYLQDSMSDDGWGCAYRSLQTLASWLYLQGYTEKKIPTFKEIQTCLVDIGDKQLNFIGSSQWIGSTEVNFVISSLFNIDCKIIYCSNGAEIATYGPDLVNHFKTMGSPIMIGGGVLAHTILGVDYNQETGGIKFLILDPHYTGGEDITTITKKGWCGWKGIDFWNKTSYYNMCLPQVSRGI